MVGFNCSTRILIKEILNKNRKKMTKTLKFHSEDATVAINGVYFTHF